MPRIPLTMLSVLTAVVLAACGGGGDDSAGAGGASPGAGGGTVAVTGTDGLAFEPSQLSVAAGEVTVELTTEPAVNHTFVIEGVSSEEPIVEAAAGETATGTVTLEAGSYTFYCDVPGHREAGMEGTLEVQG